MNIAKEVGDFCNSDPGVKAALVSGIEGHGFKVRIQGPRSPRTAEVRASGGTRTVVLSLGILLHQQTGPLATRGDPDCSGQNTKRSGSRV